MEEEPTKKDYRWQIAWGILWFALTILILVIPGDFKEKQFPIMMTFFSVTLIIPFVFIMHAPNDIKASNLSVIFFFYFLGCILSLLYGHYIT